MIEDNPEDLIHDQFASAFWADHPLGRPVIGTPASVAAIDRDQMLHFMGQRYVGDNLCVVAAGALDHAELVGLAAQAFADLPPVGVEPVAVAPVVSRTIEVRHRDLEQVQVCLGVEGLPQNHEDRYGTYLLNTILGGNMSSRLFQSVREELGLAYSVYSYHHNHSDSGAFIVYAGAAAADAPRVTRLILDEMDRLRREPVSRDELQSARDYLKGSMLLALESTDNRMSRLAKNELFLRGDGISLEQSRAMIDAVSVAQIQALAQRLFIDRTLNLQVAGKVDEDAFPASDICFSNPS